MNVIKSNFTPSEATKNLTLAELMIGFFHFYTSFYDPDIHVISASHPTCSLVPLTSYVEELTRSYGDIDFLAKTFVNDVATRKWAYVIVDPFDRTYNPARLVVSLTHQEEFVYEAMLSTLDFLVEEGELQLEMTDEDFYQRRRQEKKKQQKIKRRKRTKAKQTYMGGGLKAIR